MNKPKKNNINFNKQTNLYSNNKDYSKGNTVNNNFNNYKISNTNDRKLTYGYNKDNALENKYNNTKDNFYNENLTKTYEKEKKFIEDNYNTKNIGLLGFSFFSYLGSKAKSLFNNESEEKLIVNKSNFSEDLINNDILNRVSIVQCSANNPVEDRFNAVQLKNINGYYLSVLDGHGGNQVADYANKKLHLYFDNRFKYHENSDFQLKQKIQDSLLYAFEAVVSINILLILIYYNILFYLLGKGML